MLVVRPRYQNQFARVVARHVEVTEHRSRSRRDDLRTDDALVDAHDEQDDCDGRETNTQYFNATIRTTHFRCCTTSAPAGTYSTVSWRS